MTTLRVGSATHVGRVRPNNQDSLLVGDHLFAVADGMGGHAAGEVASQVAIEQLAASLEPTLEGLVRAVRYANRAVWSRAQDDDALRGMGTTLCAIALVPAEREALADGDDGEAHAADDQPTDDGDRVVVANVGDSRVYLFHEGVLDQISEDHSLVAELVRDGRISPDDARVHPQRNVLTRVLGHDTDVEVDAWEIIPFTGDRFLLCSDGLFGEVPDAQIAGVLRRLSDPGDAAHELVRLANDAGGRDNITVVVVDVIDDGGRSAAASTALADSPGIDGTVLAPPPPSPLGDPRSSRPPVTAAPKIRRTRALTWRVVAFVVAVLAVVAVGCGAVVWYARGTYYVGVDNGEVVIFQGRPGGVLWFEPTVVEPTGIDANSLPSALQGDLTDGKLEASLADARRYVATLERRAEEFGSPVSPTTTTTTPTVAPADPATSP